MKTFLILTLLLNVYAKNFGAYLVINPEAFASRENPEVIRRRLEIDWYGLDQFNGEAFIGLYDGEGQLMETINTTALALDGYDYHIIEEIQLKNLSSAEIGYKSRCVFPYSVRVLNSSTLMPMSNARCIKAEPEWMWERKEYLGDFAISELMLVATHDAGAYKQYDKWQANNRRRSFVYTQEEDLEQQLQYGVRFQDIRIGHCEFTED